ncbi:DNA polymerase IV 2 [Listeria weihenstephanensis FSL R9-0317]|uniref:Excinuclease ABC subunit A n=1 Tax=Listeria weihenstephanensis TaxID=1006155 RepID=A0A1S7FQK6_9LIST|nr:excinuclease ABC subunit A [Listeria weihenstephanensis]EUJ39605.1 DNA polymerase IV 2 [Listeria weihenstephanensis FSL R9-0317]
MSNQESQGGLVLAATPKMKDVFHIKTGSRRYEIPEDTRIVVAEPRMKLYLQVNELIVEIFKRYVAPEHLLIYSIDEAILDVSHSHSLFGDTMTIAKRIQKDILDELRLYVTIGIGDNPLLAKVALDVEAKHQEDGIAEWRYADVPSKLWRVKPMTEMWGIGRRTEVALNRLGIYTIYDLAHTEPSILRHAMGLVGEELYYHANGVDYTDLAEKYVPLSKSYSKNQILERDYPNHREVEIVIREMVEDIAMRLRREHAESAVVHLAIGYSRYSTRKGFSHQMKIHPTDSSKKIAVYVLHLFRKHVVHEPIRSISVQLGKISYKTGTQLNLFENAVQTVNQEQLERTIDKIRDRYGFQSLMHASSLANGATGRKRATMVGGHKG